MKSTLLFILLCLSLALHACGESGGHPAGPARADGKITVVCTTTMIADLARQIAGEDAHIVGIMKTGEDPHIYNVRPRDAQLIAAADVVLANGLHLESTLEQIIANSGRESAVVAKLAEQPGIKPLASADTQGAADPHCWFNIAYFRLYAEAARDALIKADAAHAEGYRQRAAAYVKQLDELEDWTRQQLEQVPRPQRVMVTSHDAFQYFGAAYGVDVHGVIGISTEQAPRPQDIQRLEQLVRDRKVKALFIETSVSATLNEMVRKVAAATGAKVGGTLYSDSLGEENTPAGTYIGMMKHNVQTLVEALK